MQNIAINSLGQIRDASAKEGLQIALNYMHEALRQNEEAIIQISGEGILPSRESVDELNYLEYEKEKIKDISDGIEYKIHHSEDD